MNNTKNNLIKVINNNFVFDGSTGQTYFMGENMIQALIELLDLPYPKLKVKKPEFTEKAKEIIKKKIEEGSINKVPLKGYETLSENEIKSPSLSVLTLVVTEKCNLRCKYCPYSCKSSNIYRKHSLKNMSLQTADNAVDFFISNASKKTALGFYGGEPFLNFKLIKHVVNRIKKEKSNYEPTFTVTTNLNYITDEIIDFIAENKFYLMVSIDGPQKVHDRYRKKIDGSGSFLNVQKHLNMIKQKYPSYYSQYVITNSVLAPPLNLNLIEKYFSTMKPKFSDSNFALANEGNPQFYTSLGMSRKKTANKINQWAINKLLSIKESQQISESVLLKSILRQNINPFENPSPPNKKGFLPFKACVPGNKILVNIDGSMSICDKCETLKIGHVKTGIDFQKTKQIVEEWHTILDNDCLNCWASSFCGACYIVAWNGNEFDKNKLKKYCLTLKNKTYEWLKIYLPKKKMDSHFFDCLKNS